MWIDLIGILTLRPLSEEVKHDEPDLRRNECNPYSYSLLKCFFLVAMSYTRATGGSNHDIDNVKTISPWPKSDSY